ncbi:MAG TPA: hypothetical protein DCW51_02225 [Clostridium sp.]|nr:hypothetical protein [Clostridium sp.]
MILGYDTLDKTPFLNHCYTDKTQEEIQLSNMIIDEIKMDESLDINNTIEKEEWGMFSSLVADFKGNLEGGNIENQGIPIQKIRVKKRKVGELKWETLMDFTYDSDRENYDLLDYYVETAQNYEYTLVPVTQSIEGTGVSNTIYVNYQSLFLTSDSENFAFRFDSKIDSITQNKDETIINTLSSKYPIIIRGLCNYESGQVTAKPISDTSIEQGYMDLDSQKSLSTSLYEFLHNGKPMLLRYFNMYYLVTISNVSRTPTEYVYGAEDVTFTWTQIGDTDTTTLEANGLTYSTRNS